MVFSWGLGFPSLVSEVIPHNKPEGRLRTDIIGPFPHASPLQLPVPHLPPDWKGGVRSEVPAELEALNWHNLFPGKARIGIASSRVVSLSCSLLLVGYSIPDPEKRDRIPFPAPVTCRVRSWIRLPRMTSTDYAVRVHRLAFVSNPHPGQHVSLVPSPGRPCSINWGRVQPTVPSATRCPGLGVGLDGARCYDKLD